MLDVRERPEFVERAFLVRVVRTSDDAAEAVDLVDELAELTTTLGVGIVGREQVRVRELRSRLLMGSGRADDIVAAARGLDADCLIFDNSLSPAQQRNWETLSRICVIDRQEVILDIFGRRAQTREARLQVELARMEYSLPRLTKAWTHLGRQGGSGGTGDRGEGEMQIEMDRRQVRQRISQLKVELVQVRKHRATQRKSRQRVPLPVAAIVGYTNAGKSSLLRALTGADVFVEDKLFATLDTTTRRMALENGHTLLLTDTVGFVRQLPHRLIEAFKATLEEAVVSDFLVHVMDVSHANLEAFYTTTLDVLDELGARQKRMLTVFNKVDLVSASTLAPIRDAFPEAIFVSVKTGEGFGDLRSRLAEMLMDNVVSMQLTIPHARSDIVSAAYDNGTVHVCRYEGEAVCIEADFPRRLAARFRPFAGAAES